jgi:hypothetical protein
LIRANIQIVHALVEALIERGTLSGDEIDTIIARDVAIKALATERARRVAWRIVEKNAADLPFTDRKPLLPVHGGHPAGPGRSARGRQGGHLVRLPLICSTQSACLKGANKRHPALLMKEAPTEAA